MSDSEKKLHLDHIDRRDFLKHSAVTTAVAATLGAASIPSTSQGAKASTGSTAVKRTPQGIPIQKFGKNGPELPILGYGGAGLPTKWGNKSPMEYRIKNVRHAYDQGIRFFDTSSNYGEATDIYGKALKDVRKDVYYVTKIHSQKPEDVRAAVEGELEKLGTDQVDAVLLHGTPGLITLELDQAFKIRDELLKLRDEKLMKYVGVSSHSFFEKTLNFIKGGSLDLCMLAVGYISRGGSMLHTTRNIEHCRACVAEAYDQGMGIIGMKVIAAGMLGSQARIHTKKEDFSDAKLKELPGAAIRYVHSDPRISLQVIGMPKNEEIDQNVKTFAGDLDYTIADRKMLSDYTILAYNGPRMSKIRIE